MHFLWYLSTIALGFNLPDSKERSVGKLDHGIKSWLFSELLIKSCYES
jgi:hypothetical protein